MSASVDYAPGMRIMVRSAEWLVRRVDRTSTGGYAIDAIGMDELVRDKESIFLSEIEPDISILKPEETKLVPDASSGFRASLLHMESLLRRTPPTDDRIYCGHRAAMDSVPYQLDPAIKALQQPRQRILIADAVGLGKTLEAGILLTELIRRGRGKRILVVVIKSMLTQFQKEMWTRFTIPLTRLDSAGIKRVRARIPTNHNPFHYYDRSIISVDTLKQSREYRVYLEQAHWDIIVIDEAQNVAQRGSGSSQRARLAQLLADRSDALIMLSATPHDGRARSFASLMNMLDPTAIADADHYGPDDIKGLFIRRFKKDIQNQVQSAFKSREILKTPFPATPAEEYAFDRLTETQFTSIDQRRHAGGLFKTTLEKALFSSPAACQQTINNRIRRLEKDENAETARDIEALHTLARAVKTITPDQFSRYQQLLHLIRSKEGFGWTGRDPADRLVIFTERIETLKFLKKHLTADLDLNEKQVELLHGGLSDVEQQRIVEGFGQETSPVRLLLASDVASEGINLHYLSHRIIHFDIPWSLMIFQQRNGRIDRYGQERTPQIAYLITQSQNTKIKGDMRILELLIEKDEQAHRNIGDPLSLMGAYDETEEERLTAQAMERGQTPDQFDAFLQNQLNDPLAILLGEVDVPTGADAEFHLGTMPSLFENDYAFLKAALTFVKDQKPLQVTFYDDQKQIELVLPEDLKHRFRLFPHEILPEDGMLLLSGETDAIQKEMKRCRKDEKAWPSMHFLWEHHPVLEWANDTVLAGFGRHEAPILTLSQVLDRGEVVFVLSGLIPNRQAQPLIQRWFGVSYVDGAFRHIEPFEELIARTGLGSRPIPNPGEAIDTPKLQALLHDAIHQATLSMKDVRNAFEKEANEKLQDQLDRLETLQKRRLAQLEREFAHSKQPEALVAGRKEKKERDIQALFDRFFEWMEDTMTTEDNPYIKVVAVLRDESS